MSTKRILFYALCAYGAVVVIASMRSGLSLTEAALNPGLAFSGAFPSAPAEWQQVDVGGGTGWIG